MINGNNKLSILKSDFNILEDRENRKDANGVDIKQGNKEHQISF